MSNFSALLLSGFLCLSLAGCATSGGYTPDTGHAKPESLSKSVEKANKLYAVNKPSEAVIELSRIAALYPTSKVPWLRMAQVSFDSGVYSDAIIKAQEVLKRDSQDKVANSIIAVSGLRLAVKSLADLRTQNELTPSLKSDAEELAKTLRDSLGEYSLVTKEIPPKLAPKLRVKKKVSASSLEEVTPKAVETKDTKYSNPFGILN